MWWELAREEKFSQERKFINTGNNLSSIYSSKHQKKFDKKLTGIFSIFPHTKSNSTPFIAHFSHDMYSLFQETGTTLIRKVFLCLSLLCVDAVCGGGVDVYVCVSVHCVGGGQHVMLFTWVRLVVCQFICFIFGFFYSSFFL